MRADPDFTAYVVARWAPVVRMLVLLGLPAERAEETAVEAFARMLPDWRQLSRTGDVDVELARTVLSRWARRRSDEPAPRVAVPVPSASVLTPELEDQLALLGRLLAGLDGLDEPDRVTVVLHHLGELDTTQLGETLGEPPALLEQRLAAAQGRLGLGPLDDVCRRAARAIPVEPAPVSRVVAHADAGRRRQWLVTAGALGALVLVAGVAFVLTRPEPPAEPQDLRLNPVENPIDLVWWADGVLHLDHATAKVADVAQLVEAGPGAVYATASGAVSSVTDDGVRIRLGTLDPDTKLVADPDAGLVAWVEPGGDVVVRDVVTDREVSRTGGEDARTIGFDRGRLYFSSDGQDQSVTSTRDRTNVASVAPPDGATESRLVDISSGTELRTDAGLMSAVQPLFSVAVDLPGSGGRLSLDGNYVLVTASTGLPLLYDTRSGVAELPWFDESWTAVAASFSPEGRVIWVVDDGDATLGLLSCAASHRYITSAYPDREPCTQLFDLDATVPVLAGGPIGAPGAVG